MFLVDNLACRLEKQSSHSHVTVFASSINPATPAERHSMATTARMCSMTDESTGETCPASSCAIRTVECQKPSVSAERACCLPESYVLLVTSILNPALSPNIREGRSAISICPVSFDSPILAECFHIVTASSTEVSPELSHAPTIDRSQC